MTETHEQAVMRLVDAIQDEYTRAYLGQRPNTVGDGTVARLIQNAIPVGEIREYLIDEAECLCHQYSDDELCQRCKLLAKLEPKP